ncbi:MAG TPA: glycosyltransferase [Candidatus Angelobacter sp.]|nr:glycosyltransferase [Candidatus Angelobacter sp.]
MKKVCIFGFPRMENFHGYSIDSLDPAPYFPSVDRQTLFQKLSEAKSLDQMYRGKNPSYMRFLGDFVDKFRDADLLVAYIYNAIHPEVLSKELSKPIKVLGFIDDPFSTYVRGVPYLWAFDGAFHISPSYNDQLLFQDALAQWGCEQSYWWPLVIPRAQGIDERNIWPLVPPRAEAQRRGDAFFRERDLDLIYVGAPYSSKMDRLAVLKKRFGSRMRIHGRWPYAGYVGMLRSLRGKPAIWTRIAGISEAERTHLYYRTRIGINVHLSDTPAETGNMRMYEVPAHGMMLLCDKAGMNAHKRIFVPDKEAVFYDSTDDAIAKIEYYLKHHEERDSIARAGFARVHRDYDGETNMKKFLDWAIGLPKSALKK